MTKGPRKGKSLRPSKREPTRIRSAQILRQVVVIVVVVALWSALLVGYLALTKTSAEPSAAATATKPTTPEATAPLPSFTADVLPIFEARCVRCHGGTSASAGLNLSSHGDVMTGSRAGPVVVPGSAADSSLVQALVSGRMPRGAPKLPDAEIQTISDWVDGGAPDN